MSYRHVINEGGLGYHKLTIRFSQLIFSSFSSILFSSAIGTNLTSDEPKDIRDEDKIVTSIFVDE
jgi:hypothetical protein